MARTQGHGNPVWTRDETILALELYLDCQGIIPSDSDDRVMRLSKLIQELPHQSSKQKNETYRNAAGVAFKLQNLRQVATGKGLGNTSALDREIWAELGENPNQVKSIAAIIRKCAVIANSLPKPSDDEGDDDEIFMEGRLATYLHKRRERSRKIRKKLITNRKERGALNCDICSRTAILDDRRMDDALFEAHHVIPLGMSFEREVHLRDMALICANCHRLLHRAISLYKRWIPIPEAVKLIGKPSIIHLS